MGIFDLLRAAIVPAAEARAGYLQGQEKEKDKQHQTLLEQIKLERQRQIDEANIAHTKAQTAALNEGAWGNAFNAVDEDGHPILVQQHKQTGKLRRATLDDATPPISADAVTNTATAATPARAAVAPAMGSLAGVQTGVEDSQNMGDRPSSPLDVVRQAVQQSPPQQPQQSPLSGEPSGGQQSSGGKKKATGALSPYVKPTTSTRPASMIPGTPEWKAAQTEAAIIREQHRAAGSADRVLVAVEMDDGQGGKKRVLIPRSQAAGMSPVAGTGAMNAQNKLTEARAKAAVAEMNNADPSMAEYEDKLKIGTANISGLSQYLNQVGNDFVKNENPAKQTAALAILNKKNPELARYIRRGLSFAEGESQISSRPSDFRTKMAAFLSTAAVGASPEMIDDIRSRRTAILTPLNEVYPPSGGGGRSGGRGRKLDPNDPNYSAPPKGSAGPDSPGGVNFGAPVAPRPAAGAGGDPTTLKLRALWDAAEKKHGTAATIHELGARP